MTPLRSSIAVGLCCCALLLASVAGAGPTPKPAQAKLPESTNSVGMKLALIPAGKFTMGSAPGEWGRGRNEEPRREVTITRPFYMSRGETGNGQFMKFLEETKYKPVPLGESDSMFLYYQKGKGLPKYRKRAPNRPDHPAIWVSWYAACRFCNWLSKKEGRKPVYVFQKPKKKGRPPEVVMAHPYDGGYRLPMEAEWEYAARAGTTTAFSFGSDDRDFRKHAFSYSTDPYSGGVNNMALHSRTPNPWGLYQMHGNVHEWCWDWYAPGYDPNRTVDPTGPQQGRYRVTRGGAMRLPTAWGRSAARMLDDPTSTRYDVGFRVVRSAVDPK